MASKWSPKDPTDVADYGVDWSAFLAKGETIVTKTVTVETGLTAVSSTIKGTTVIIRLSGGADGIDYDVTCLITTSLGQTFEVTKPLLVRNRYAKLDTR